MTTLAYLLGPPGSGKTTVTRELARRAGWVTQPVAGRFPYQMHTDRDGNPQAVTLGKDSPPFGGTDTLSWTVADTLGLWLTGAPAPLVIGEGDRLATPRFLDQAALLVNVRLFYLNTPPEVCAARRALRAERHGLRLQNPEWVKGRATKHARLAAHYEATPLNYLDPVTELAAALEIPC